MQSKIKIASLGKTAAPCHQKITSHDKLSQDSWIMYKETSKKKISREKIYIYICKASETERKRIARVNAPQFHLSIKSSAWKKVSI